MSDEETRKEEPRVERNDKLLIAGASLPIVEAAIAAMHGGPIGAIVGLGVSGLVYIVADEMAQRGKAIALPRPSRPKRKQDGDSNKVGDFFYRAFTAKDLRDEKPGEEQEDASGSTEQGDDGEYLDLGPCLRPHVSAVLSKRLGMFGIPGSGKTNGLTVFLEELGKLGGIGVPFVMADTEGEYEALHSTSYLMRPYKAGAHNVTPENAFQFGQSVLERGRQVILNLQSYESDDDAALVMIGMIKGMQDWAEARPNDERATCMFILDEAAVWLPQRQEESILSREKDEHGQTILARLQQVFFRTVVRRGRKRGIGFLFATQRPADLDKRCISCDWLILFRQTFPNDLSKYAELGVPKDAAQALSPGEAFVIDPQGQKAVYQFRMRRSPDNSRSPGLASLKKHAQRWMEPEREVPVEDVSVTPAVVPPLPDLEPNPRRLTHLHRQALVGQLAIE